MTDTTTTPEPDAPVEPDPSSDPVGGAPDAAEAALGDAGKKALLRMRAERDQARAELKALGGDSSAAQAKARELETLREQIAELTAKAEGREAEYAAEQARRAVEAEALGKANERILRSEVKAAAAQKLADPGDAYKFLDLSQFEVDGDGNVDEAAIAQAIDDLLEKKPYLAAQGGPRFKGGGDGGTRKGSTKSIDDAIAEASAAGNHALAISLKRQKAYANDPSS